MKIETPVHAVELNGTVKTREFTVKAGAHIMSVLSNLYTDPSDAMVREYTTNMLDAYVALRNKRGVEMKDWRAPILSLPTKLEPVLMFKDFGIGMDENTVWNVYCQYGNSTKNDSNDEVGGFGLGSKVAFCYNGGSAWGIESRHDGKLHIFTAYVGKDGVPNLTHVSTSDTTEPNGVTIKIPIQRSDIERVVTAGEKYARYYPMPIQVVNASQDYQQDINYLLNGQQWGLHNDKGTTDSYGRLSNVVNVVMGNVPYPISSNDVSGYHNVKFHHDGIAKILQHFAFDLFVKIGEVDIVPSRDALQYTEKTRKAIDTAFKAMMKDMPRLIQDHITAAKSEHEAFTMIVSLMNTLKGAFDSQIDLSKLKWNGKTFNFNKGIARTLAQFQKFDPKGAMIVYTNADFDTLTKADSPWPMNNNYYYRAGGLGEIGTADVAWIGHQHQYVVLNDMAKGGDKVAKSYLYHKVMNKTSSGRKAKWGHKAGMLVMISSTKSPQEIADFFGGMPVADVQLLSALASTVVIPKAVKGTVDAVYKWSGSSWAARVNRPSTTDKYFLPIEKSAHSGRWSYTDGTEKSHYSSTKDSVRAITTVLALVGANRSSQEIYGVKPEDMDSLDSSWVNLKTLAWEKGLEFLTQHAEHTAIVERNVNMMTDNVVAYVIPFLKKLGNKMKGDTTHVLTVYENTRKVLEKSGQVNTSAVNRWLTANADTVDGGKDALAKVRKEVEQKLKSVENVIELCKEIIKPYPMIILAFGPRDNSYYHQASMMQEVMNRIVSNEKTLLDYIGTIS